jgi:preprotein translocase subunit SecY
MSAEPMTTVILLFFDSVSTVFTVKYYEMCRGVQSYITCHSRFIYFVCVLLLLFSELFLPTA